MTRLARELLRAELDLDHATPTESQGSLALASRTGVAREALASLFVAPAIYLAWSAWSSPSLRLFAFAICPVLALFALVFCCARFEKAYRPDRSATSAFWLLGYRISRTEIASNESCVRLSSDWELDPPSWQYRVRVDGLEACTLVSRHYSTACAAAQAVADEMGLAVRDETTPKSRKSGN